MLRALNIRDFVIVERMELEFDDGFTVLTGETGAGKSILLDALGLALGDRADAAVVRAGAERAEIHATFDRPMARNARGQRRNGEAGGDRLRPARVGPQPGIVLQADAVGRQRQEALRRQRHRQHDQERHDQEQHREQRRQPQQHRHRRRRAHAAVVPSSLSTRITRLRTNTSSPTVTSSTVASAVATPQRSVWLTCTLMYSATMIVLPAPSRVGVT